MKQQIEKIYQNIKEFCQPKISFNSEEEEYIKKSLEQAYLEGEGDILNNILKDQILK